MRTMMASAEYSKADVSRCAIDPELGSPSGLTNIKSVSCVELLPQTGNYYISHLNTLISKIKSGGRYWTRTSDPCDVNTVLYQLS